MKYVSPMDTLTLLYIAFGIIVILIAWIIRLEVKIKRLLGGREQAKSIEEGIVFLAKDIQELVKNRDVTKKQISNLHKRLRRSVQAVETIRFNPFEGTGAGGNQSFSTSFVNEDGDGIVISTLHARDRMSVFSKPVQKFNSEHELSDEEKEVIMRARTKLENDK